LLLYKKVSSLSLLPFIKRDPFDANYPKRIYAIIVCFPNRIEFGTVLNVNIRLQTYSGNFSYL